MLLEGLDTINWSELHHAYGSAADVPQLLRDLTSSDGGIFERAMWHLSSNIFDQGARYEASAYAIPFLIELVNEPSLDRRNRIFGMLLHVAIDDDPLDDYRLPFHVERVFPMAGGIIVSDHTEFFRTFYSKDNRARTELDKAFMEKLRVAWARDAYMALQSQAEIFLKWVIDANDAVAQLALASLPWLPILHYRPKVVLETAMTSERSADYKTTAIIALCLIPAFADAKLKAQLEKYLVTAEDLDIQWGSAIGLVLGFGKEVSNKVAETLRYVAMLREHEGWSESFSIETDGPFDRTFIGFDYLAIERLGV